MKLPFIAIDNNKKELTQHGEANFPLAAYKTAIKNSFLGYIDWHWHEELQFCLVTRGTVQFYINNDVCTLSEKEGIFINAGQLHRSENYKDTDSEYICIDIHPNFITGFADSLINSKYIFPYVGNNSASHCILNAHTKWQASILKAISEIYKQYTERASCFELQVYTQVVNIWDNLTRNYFINLSSGENNLYETRLKKVLGYIHEHYSEKLELETIAKEIHMSKSACCREFKRHMKITVFDYITNYRLTMSAHFLETTDLTIAEIAFACGFGSSSYFIEKFRLQKGVSPAKYRSAVKGAA